jgi:cellulose synthase/poly-beta-1,6-N-acetylglucosamine synthase-like glycosyltransferase
MFPRVLKYVKGAVGETDVPDAFPEFISQRRRWLNGSLFAATYAIAHIGQILRSGHSFARKIFLTIETIYNVINLIFSWFSIVSTALWFDQSIYLPIFTFKGNFYIFFVSSTSLLSHSSEWIHRLFSQPRWRTYHSVSMELDISMHSLKYVNNRKIH